MHEEKHIGLWLFQSVCGECIQVQIRHSGEGILNFSVTPERGSRKNMYSAKMSTFTVDVFSADTY